MKKLALFLMPTYYPRVRYLLLVGLASLLLPAMALGEEVYKEQTIEETEDLSPYFTQYEPVSHRFLSGAMSLIFPGLGQMLNQEYLKGITHGAVTFAAQVTVLGFNTDNYEEERAWVETNNERDVVYITRNKLLKDSFRSLETNMHLYSSFDAYRHASIANDVPIGVVPVSNESLLDLSLAPFTPKYILDPYVFVPFIATSLFFVGRSNASTANRNNFSFFRYSEDLNRPMIIGINMVRQETIAVGEEAFFRGVVNTETMRYMGPVYGVLTSSVFFGLTHTSANQGILYNPYTATMYGMYLGFVHKIKNGQLGYNVALHYWWDIAIMLATMDLSKEVTVPVLSIRF